METEIKRNDSWGDCIFNFAFSDGFTAILLDLGYDRDLAYHSLASWRYNQFNEVLVAINYTQKKGSGWKINESKGNG